MSDPDSLIQKVLHNVDVFVLDIAIPNIPQRLKKQYEKLQEESDKAIFRKIWSLATQEEKEVIESDIDYAFESDSPCKSSSKEISKSSSPYSSSRGSDSYSDYSSNDDEDDK